MQKEENIYTNQEKELNEVKVLNGTDYEIKAESTCKEHSGSACHGE